MATAARINTIRSARCAVGGRPLTRRSTREKGPSRPIVPESGCQAGAKVQIFVSEKTFGKEQVKVKIDKLLGNVPLAFFGDPIAGTTGYAICLYDAAGTSVASAGSRRSS